MEIPQLYDYYVSNDYKLYTGGTIVFYILFTIAERLGPGAQCQAKWLEKLSPNDGIQYQPLDAKETPPAGPAPIPLSPPPGSSARGGGTPPSSRTGSSPCSETDDRLSTP